eukprot:s8955_g1.t1
MSLALSCALANTLATRGIHARRVLTMVAGTLSEMEGVRVDITPLSDQLARSHPNTLWLSDLEEPEEETPAADPSEEDLTRRVATDMEREGRTAMTRDEEAILDRTTLRENSLDRADHAAHAATSEAYLAAVWGPPATDTGDVTVKACRSSAVEGRAQDQGLADNLANASEMLPLSQKQLAETANEQGATDCACTFTTTLARYSTWRSLPTSAHSLLSMLQEALHSSISVVSESSLVHRIIHQLHKAFAMLQAWSSPFTVSKRAILAVTRQPQAVSPLPAASVASPMAYTASLGRSF